MDEKHDIQSLGLEIMDILESFHLPSNDFVFEFHLSTQIFDRISISWQHFSQVKEDIFIPKIDFPLFDERIYLLLKSYNYEIRKYGLIIGLPYQIFDTYIKNFPEELTSTDVIQKTGNKIDTTWYYVLQRRKIMGMK